MKNPFEVSIILQARTGSTRLPNKMIKPFYDEKSLLEIIITRLKEAEIPIIVATTINPNDDSIVSIAHELHVNIFRGSENNVLSRFIGAAKQFNVSKIIRVCADNPLLDIDSLLFLKNSFVNSSEDYWCFVTKDKLPTIKTHYGFWAEGVTIEALNKVQTQTIEQFYTEHVTNFIYLNSNKFLIHYEPINPNLEKLKLRLTIDTPKDFELIKKIYSELIDNNIDLKADKISNYITKKSDWLEIMYKEIIQNSK